MSVFEHSEFRQHEQIIHCYDHETQLKAIVAIHNTAGGPALGGCRMWPYGSEEEALTDVLRLSRGMTYKALMADIPHGGGKSVIIGHVDQLKTPDLLRAMGRFVNTLGGRYIIAEDMGMNEQDMGVIHSVSPYVVGYPGGCGNPSPATSYGVYVGIRSCVKRRLNRSDLKGVRVAVQGLGHVGVVLCNLLSQAGAELWVTDIDPTRTAKIVETLGATAVLPHQIYDLDVDVFAPCAMGSVINDQTIPQLKAKIIAGAANNQLQRTILGTELKSRGILYAPDFVINGGGLIYVTLQQWDEPSVHRRLDRIENVLDEIFDYAERHQLATSIAATQLAETKLRAISTKPTP